MCTLLCTFTMNVVFCHHSSYMCPTIGAFTLEKTEAKLRPKLS